MKKNKMNFRSRIFVPVSLVLAIMLVVIIIGVYRFNYREIYEKHSESCDKVKRLFNTELGQDADLFEKTAALIKKDKAVRAAWHAKNRQELLVKVRMISDSVYPEPNKTYIYIHNPDRTNFLRIHEPGKYGDYIERFTMAQAERTHKTARGIELSPQGLLTLRMVSPWYIDNKLVGYVEFGEKTENIFKDIKKILKNDVLLAVNKSSLNRSSWETARTKLGKKSNWDTYNDYVIVNGTMPQSCSAAFTQTLSLNNDHKQFIFEAGDQEYIGGFVRLKDTTGKYIGYIIVFDNVTRDIASARNLLLILSLSAIVVFAVLTGFFYIYIKHLDDELTSTQRAQQEEIRQRKTAQNTLRQNQAELEAIYENAPLMMMLIDEDRHLRKVNKTTAELLNKPKDSILSLRAGEALGCVYALTNPEGCGHSRNCRDCPIRNAILETIKTGKTYHRFEAVLTLDRGNGPMKITTLLTTKRIEVSDERLALVCIEDITSQKHAEEALRLAKKSAEKASKSKSLFLANMSHEIRTPMNAIIGYSEMLIEEHLGSQQASYARTIRNSGKLLLQLINDILDFSRIEAGKMSIEPKPFSIKKILKETESIIKPIVIEKGLEFRIRIDESAPAVIRSDSSRLSQCLINLANNAVKFTKHGHVHINVSAGDLDGKPAVRFDVEDTGIGISAENQQKVFKAFTQEDLSTSRKFGGTGLGLTITKQLAHLLGGYLTLASEPGKGTTFTLVIPNGIDNQGRSEADIEDSPGLGQTGNSGKLTDNSFTGSVLVAEDVITNQTLMKTMLSKLSIEVTIACNGAEAVEKALNGNFDLILMDIQMPVVNGYEATSQLRQKGLETPIVALTANSMTGDKKACIDCGCNDYLSKPINRAKLLEMLNRYLKSGVKKVTCRTAQA